MNQILHCDWLPEGARWSYLARSGPPFASHKKFPRKSYNKSFNCEFYCEFMDLDSVSVHELAKTELSHLECIVSASVL